MSFVELKGTSMGSYLRTGDIVWVESELPERVGQLVALEVMENGEPQTLVHRFMGGRGYKGDANKSYDNQVYEVLKPLGVVRYRRLKNGLWMNMESLGSQCFARVMAKLSCWNVYPGNKGHRLVFATLLFLGHFFRWIEEALLPKRALAEEPM